MIGETIVRGQDYNTKGSYIAIQAQPAWSNSPPGDTRNWTLIAAGAQSLSCAVLGTLAQDTDSLMKFPTMGQPIGASVSLVSLGFLDMA